MISRSPLRNVVVAAGLFLSGCSAHKAVPLAPIVQSAQVVVAGTRESIAPGTAKQPVVNVKITAKKADLLEQEFLYGADLQYSSFYDKDMDLYNQSLALGHIPARFRIAGDELQLVADNKRLYPSEVNHPEQLLSRFKILIQDEDTLTVSSANSGPLLGQIFEATHTGTPGSILNPGGKTPRDLWVRSFQFIPDGNYLLQETSVLLEDGTIGEFMESIFPRQVLTAGSKFEKFEMDPESPVGGDEGAVSRYRLLRGESIRDGEKKLAFAQHFDISGAGDTYSTIDWYVTANITDEEIVPVKLAVEGWNRYFRKMKGVEKDIVLFKGRLPQDVKLGDPRFNVINWDNRLVAGAAYESQASDPQSGKQSHSLIYMPAAWLKIGTDYWQNGQYSDTDSTPSVGRLALSRAKGALRTARVACLRDVKGLAIELSSGRLSQDEVKVFGAELLKQTLFHEVGHALGLDHNFKGSLSYDRSKPGSPATTSIMDYNDFELERESFSAVDSAEGPELEYDRQALSAIYNQAKDVASSDAVVPTCNDEEADAEEGGVDPLCIRYDIENDPTHATITALERVTLPVRQNDVTLAQAMAHVPGDILSSDALAAVQTQADLKALGAKLGSAIRGAMKFHFISGKASLSRMVRTNLKSLLQFQDGILPAGYDEAQMRERAFDGVQKVMALRSLPDVLKTALEAVSTQSASLVSATPFIVAQAAEGRASTLNDFKAALVKSVVGFESDEAAGLPKLRSAVLTALSRHESVPFFFGKIGESRADFEAAILNVLTGALSTQEKRTDSERLAAAGTLSSFKGRPGADAAIEAVRGQLKLERLMAEDNESRESVEAILDALK